MKTPRNPAYCIAAIGSLGWGCSSTPPPAAPQPVAEAHIEPQTLPQLPSVERRMHVRLASASSFLQNDWNRFEENYHPNYSFDDDPKTAWTAELQESEGKEAPWIKATVAEIADTTQVKLRILNGYQKTPQLFAANTRAKGITITLLPSGAKQTVELKDDAEWQEVSVNQPSGMLESVQISVDSVYPGGKYQDLCFSDIQLFVTSRSRENPEFEKAIFAALQTWKAERVQAAKDFPRSKLPFLPKYQRVDRPAVETEGKDRDGAQLSYLSDLVVWANAEPLLKEWAEPLALVQESLTKLSDAETFQPVKLTPSEKQAIPPLDEFDTEYFMPGTLKLPIVGWGASLRVENLRLISATDTTVTLDAIVQHDDSACQKGDKPPVISAWADSKKVNGRYQTRQVLLASCQEVEERDGTSLQHQVQLLVYDPEGRLVLTVSPMQLSAIRWNGKGNSAKISGGEGITYYGERFSVQAHNRKTARK